MTEEKEARRDFNRHTDRMILVGGAFVCIYVRSRLRDIVKDICKAMELDYIIEVDFSGNEKDFKCLMARARGGSCLQSAAL
jgi:hypothetical protein